MSSGHLGRMMLSWVVFYGDRGPSDRMVLPFGGFRFRGLTIVGHRIRGLGGFPRGTSFIARHPMSRRTLRVVAPAAAKTLSTECP